MSGLVEKCINICWNKTLPNNKPQLYLVKTDTGIQIILDTVPPDSKTIVDEVRVESHLPNKELPEPKEYTECEKSYRLLDRHIRLKHKDSKKVNSSFCATCGKHVHNINRHRHTKEYPCSVCLANFKSEDMMIEHREIHFTEHYKCDQCPLIFRTLTDLALHHFIHTNMYTCPKCSVTFKSRQSLKCHVANEEKNFRFNCHICGKGFVLQHILQSHIERHENNKKYECKICRKKFNLKIYLKSHERLNHKKELFGIEEVFQCEYCSRTFSFECSLKRHLNLVHKVGGEKHVMCNVCSKVLTTAYSLTVHMRLHTGEKKFECHTCGEKFSRTQYVTRHMARKHGTDRTTSA